MPTLIVAHRGDSAEFPENTLLAFSSALTAGAEIMELDVQLTRDGHLAVIHDPTVDRTTSGTGAVADLTLAEVRSLSAGYPARFGSAHAGERVPTLAEALGFLKDRARVVIEIKRESVTDDEDDGIEVRAVAAVRQARMQHDVAFVSFDGRALRRCRSHAPEIARGRLFQQGVPEEMVKGALDAGCQFLAPYKELLSEDLAERARAASLKLGTYIVDDPRELPGLAAYGLYSISSNRPGALIEALQESGGLGARSL
jgi:glycerophosphoryl diester phosphodiesterase